MSQSLDDKLRKALRPQDPGEAFTQRVLSRLSEVDAPARAGVAPHVRLLRTHMTGISLAALAASLVLAVTIVFWVHERQEREAGLRAREQVLQALQLTSEKLNLAVRVVHEQSARSQDDTGA